MDKDKGIGKISLKTSIGGSNHAGSLNRLSAFGKLENGVLICVPSSLIKRTKNHSVTFNFDESRDGTQPKQVWGGHIYYINVTLKLCNVYESRCMLLNCKAFL